MFAERATDEVEVFVADDESDEGNEEVIDDRM